VNFWRHLEKEHPVAYGMFYGAIITMNVSALIISLIALALQLLSR